MAILFGFGSFYSRNEEKRVAAVELESALHAILSDIQYDTPAEYLQILRKSPHGLSGAVFDESGKLIVREGAIPLEPMHDRGIKKVNGILVNYVTGSLNGKTAVVADPWQDTLDGDLRQSAVLLAVWFPLTLGVALITWVTVTRTFRPLLAMADEAGRLSAEGLHSRLAVPHDQEFGQLATRLNAFLDRIEQSVLVQEQFLQDAAHELRTPLTILRGQAQTTMIRERTPEEYQKVLHMVVDESVRMSNLVESLLVSSRTSLTPAPIQELAVIVQETVDRWQERYKESGITLTSKLRSAKASINEREVESVLDNLLNNALRHSSTGSTCTVTLTSDNGATRLEVADQGEGIPDEFKKKIFERFYRTDESRARNSGGFGIGLAICKRILQERGGTIWVEDNQPQGSKFIVEWKSSLAEKPALRS